MSVARSSAAASRIASTSTGSLLCSAIARQAEGSSSSVVVGAAAQVRRASKAAANAAGSRKKAAQDMVKGSKAQDMSGDNRLDAMRKVLFESDPSDAQRLEALRKVVHSDEVFETIQRAWRLHERHRREAHAAMLERKFTKMQDALGQLEAFDSDLFDKAVGGKQFQNQDQRHVAKGGRLDGLVPVELRPPMDLPPVDSSKGLWDADWTRPESTTEKR